MTEATAHLLRPDQALHPERLERLCDVLGLALRCPAGRVLESLAHLSGKPPPRGMSDELHRLAANVDYLRADGEEKGGPVPPWAGQRSREWAAVQCLRVVPKASARGRYGALLTFKVLTGSAAALSLRRWMTFSACRYLARLAGFSRPPGRNSREPIKRPFLNPEDLVTLRWCVLIEPRLCSVKGPGFETVDMAEDLKRWNLKQLHWRFRRKPENACPRNQLYETRCHNCPATLKQCPGSTHELPWVMVTCKACKKRRFATSDDLTTCLRCRRAAGYGWLYHAGGFYQASLHVKRSEERS